MTDQTLPYEFDLWFDIKTRAELVDRYVSLRRELEQMEGLVALHGIEFTPDELDAIDQQERRDGPAA